MTANNYFTMAVNENPQFYTTENTSIWVQAVMDDNGNITLKYCDPPKEKEWDS